MAGFGGKVKRSRRNTPANHHSSLGLAGDQNGREEYVKSDENLSENGAGAVLSANGTGDFDSGNSESEEEEPEDIRYPDNPTVQNCLTSLLSPYLFKCLIRKSDVDFLKLLNSNTQNPYLIWDNGTRSELVEYVKRNQEDIIKSGECDPSFGSDFVFTIHSKELVVGEIYVRIYNEQPGFPLEDARGFTKDLIAYLGSEAEYLQSLRSLAIVNGASKDSGDVARKQDDPELAAERKERLKKVLLALQGLRNCMKNNQGVETECVGHFKLLFSLLTCSTSTSLQTSALEVVSCVVSSRECVASIAEAQVLGFFLVCFDVLLSQTGLLMECLHAMVSNRDIVKECKNKGAFIYILHEFCSSRDPVIRAQAAELFSKLLSSNLYGTEVRLFLKRFLPPLFMEAMRDNAENSVHMFESVQENPELVWKDETREKVKKTVRKLKTQLAHEQLRDPNFVFSLPRDFVVEGIVSNDLTIEGVILTIYVKQPGWVVRRPMEFMTGLLVHFKEQVLANKASAEEVELVVNAIVCFFLASKSMLGRVPETGCIPSLISGLTTKHDGVNLAAVKILHTLSENEPCVRHLSKGGCIEPLMLAMKNRQDSLAHACEALHRMFQIGDRMLVKQAIDAELVGYLLELLSRPLEVSSQKSVKAHIVDALKAMGSDTEFGPQITAQLDESPVWKEYKNQKHDLFLENVNTAGFLTSGPQVAGYLTQAPTSPNGVSAPPPVVDSEDES